MPAARLLALLLLVVPSLARAEDAFYLKDGDRVVFYGDSITEQRLYTTFVETYVVTRFPTMHVSFVHSGWGGDRVTGGGGGSIDVRLKRDVLAYRPTVMTIMLGMNDGRYQNFNQRIFETYARGMERIVDKVKTALPDLRITLIQPSPYDDVTREPKFEGGYNAVLVRYGEFLKELAEKAHVHLADLNTPVVAATRKAYETDSSNAVKLNPDRVHPGRAGQLLMAAALLKAWHAPAIVTRVRIEQADGGLKSETQKTKLSALKKADGALSWTQRDEALPMPIDLSDPVTALAVKSSDVVADLDQQVLEVDGLEADEYTLKIDGQDVGQFTRDQLAEGVNLAVLATPMARQAAEVHKLTLKHNDIHEVRWRGLEVRMQKMMSTHVTRALKELDEFEDDVVDDQRAAAEPRSHRYELRPRS
jgi:lysophospholipase L1-like esterase